MTDAEGTDSSAPSAAAPATGEPARSDGSRLIRAARVVWRALAPVARPVGKALAPVARPVGKVLAPVARPVGRALASVARLAWRVLGPVARPVGRVLVDVRVLRVLGQLAVVVLLVGVVTYLSDNYQANLQDQGFRSGWGFLDEPTGFGIAFADFSPGQPVSDAIAVGVRNTLASAAVGIVLATAIGVLVGVVRLSQSWVARKVATIYVELLRNVPVLLIILFTASALATLPQIDDAGPLAVFGLEPFGTNVVLSNRQVAMSSPVAGDQLPTYAALLGIAAVAALGLAAWRTRRSEATGAPHHRELWAGGLLLAVAVAGYLLLDGPFTWSRPSVDGRSISGGAGLNVAYVALTGALALYHGSHIAEIVRGSIQAVPPGQTEAATAIGLTEVQRLRFVVLPQALRIAVPPTINQYLSLTKNTSLGLAVAYSDVSALGFQLIGSSRAPAVQMVAILMVIYLVISLTTSLLMNLFNWRVQLVER